MNHRDQTGSQNRIEHTASGKTTLLEQRMYQAQVAENLIKSYTEVIGSDRAIEVATAAIQADAEKSGRKIAEKYGGNSLKELSRIVKEIWCEDDALSISIIEETDRILHFDVNRCRYAELYEKMGIREFGVCLSCSRDGSFAQGFNPHIKMKRTQTIMEGAPYCDFRFTLEKSIIEYNE